MRREVFTDAEKRYIYGFRPAGFLRSWEALYQSKCHSGPWTISQRWRIYGGLERRNRWPECRVTRFPNEPRLLGWQVSIPLGVGTLAVWGYRVNRDTA